MTYLLFGTASPYREGIEAEDFAGAFDTQEAAEQAGLMCGYGDAIIRTFDGVTMQTVARLGWVTVPVTDPAAYLAQEQARIDAELAALKAQLGDNAPTWYLGLPRAQLPVEKAWIAEAST